MVRRRTLGLVAMIVLVAAACGQSPTSDTRGTAPTTGPSLSSSVAIPRGMRLVSVHGVHVLVPTGWPVVDGMHTLFCGGTPFPEVPTAFVGPNDNGPPSCPAPLRIPARDGVWLLSSVAPTDARPTRTAAGRTVLVETLSADEHVEHVWYHGVGIEIGVGVNRAVADAIFNSIAYAPGVSDTPAAGTCGRNPNPQQMPRPERLTAKLSLQHGDVTLTPPAPTDQPVEPATRAWNDQQSREWFESYQLILARYSSLFPARPGPHGYVPEEQNVLAWIVYSTPVSPTIAGCGMWGADVENALTGQPIASMGWAPGP